MSPSRRSILLVLLGVTALVAVGGVGTAGAQEHLNVSDTTDVGNDPPDCSANNVTHNDIDDAVDAATPGDTVLV